MPTQQPLTQGTILRGKYRIECVIGTGGMGVVLQATHLRLSQLVAIKMLLAEHRSHDLIRRFAREARAASRLRGEHVVRIIDVDESETGDPFLVMEYLGGIDLQQALREGGPLPCETAANYVLQACQGIAEAHAQGIVHRDLKPANLFLTTRADGTALVKILDFGISKVSEVENHADLLVTKQATALGSPAYMSPEQLRDTADVDERTDIWSLGVVLYQLLTNALPFEATSTAALAARIAADPPGTLPEHLPGELRTIVLRCLEKDRSKRFASIVELSRALGPFANDGEAHASQIARVADASAQRASSVGMPAPNSYRADDGGMATAALEDVAPDGPIHRAITVARSDLATPPMARQPKAGRRWALVIGIALAALTAIVSAWLLVRQVHLLDTSIAPTAPSHVGSAPLGTATAIGEIPHEEPASAPSALSSVRPRPTGKPAPRNPMDIEFR